MIGIAHLKTRLSQYAALWIAAFLVAGAAILAGLLVMDLIGAVDVVLPVLLVIVALALGGGVAASLLSRQTVGTKLLILALAVLLALPLLWAPVAAAVTIAFFMDRAIEYSVAYANFQIGVAEVLYPLSQLLLGGAVFEAVWAGFQVFASVVGVVSAFIRAWPWIRRALGPEPAMEG